MLYTVNDGDLISAADINQVVLLMGSMFFNVKSYGAIGDGLTDDTAAIQAAIDAVPSSGGVVFFPAGTYIISQTLTVTTSATTLLGVGYDQGSILKIKSTADPTYALQIGTVGYIANCKVEGLTLQGRNNGSLTGGGMSFGSDTGTIRKCFIYQFGGTGLYVNGIVGQIYNLYVEDIFLKANGLNTGGSDQARSNLYIDSYMANCEYVRVACNGSLTDISGSVTKWGIYVNTAVNQKFLLCHPYFHTSDGLIFAYHSHGFEVIGGEYECNAIGLEVFDVDRGSITGAQFYGNTNASAGDLGLYGTNASVSQCVLTSTGVKNLVTWGSQLEIGDTTIISTVKAIEINTGNTIILHDNFLYHSGGPVIENFAEHVIVHDNILTGDVYSGASSGNNSFHDNIFISGTFITLASTDRTKNNIGYNPVGQVTAPSFPASTVAATNTSGVDVTAYIANGAADITVIQIAGAGGSYVTTGMTIAASGTANIRIPAGGSVKFTYASGSPSWTWFGD
jgi:Pectate lyase superfamily protein